MDNKENKWVCSEQSWSKEGTVRDRQSKEARILWSHHEETRQLPGERDNARNNAKWGRQCTPGWTTTRYGQDSLWKSQPKWQRTAINGESIRPWCGQPSDWGRLENRTEHVMITHLTVVVSWDSNAAVTLRVCLQVQMVQQSVDYPKPATERLVAYFSCLQK